MLFKLEFESYNNTNEWIEIFNRICSTHEYPDRYESENFRYKVIANTKYGKGLEIQYRLNESNPLDFKYTENIVLRDIVADFNKGQEQLIIFATSHIAVFVEHTHLFIIIEYRSQFEKINQEKEQFLEFQAICYLAVQVLSDILSKILKIGMRCTGGSSPYGLISINSINL